MDWSESGGPTVAPPTRRAFGSTVINTMAKYSVGGEVAIYYAPAVPSTRRRSLPNARTIPLRTM
jgi:hypothetical protein